MQKLLLTICLLAATLGFAQSPGITVTGTLRDAQGNPNAGTVTLTLANHGSGPATVGGTYAILNDSVSAQAATDGTFSISVYGNYQLDQHGTYYSLAFYTAGSRAPISTARYVFTVPGSFNVSALVPYTSSPSGPVATPGFMTSAGAATISGLWAFSTSPTVPDPTTNLQVANKEYVDTHGGSGASTSSANTWLLPQTFNSGLQSTLFASNVDFICEGDSITAGFGLSPTTGRYCNVAQAYSALSGHVTTYANFAVAGNQISDLVSRYTASVKPYCQLAAASTVTATLLNVWVGTNDLGTGGASAATTFTALSSYWSTAKADGCKIIAYTITPRSGTQALSDAQENQRLALNDLIRTSSGWDYLMDVDALIQNPESTTYFQDGLHPTASGHFFIAQALNSVLLGTKWAYGPLFHQYHAPGTGSNNSRDNVISFASMTTGGNDTANGYQSGAAVTSSTDSTFFGYQAGVALTSGNQNTAIGSKTLTTQSTNTNSTAVGYGACFQHTGDNNTCVGQLSLSTNSTGNQNAAVGSRALIGDTTGANNVGIGYNAGSALTTGSTNVAIGAGSNASTTGSNNVVISPSNTIGTAQAQTVLIGSGTGAASDNTTAIGYVANKGTTATTPNTAIGAGALSNGAAGGESGGNNTAVGYFAGNILTSGAQNTFLGDHAGDGITTGSGNEAFGYNAKLGTAVAGAAQIGAGTNSASNTLQFQAFNFLDNSGNASVKTLTVGVGTSIASAATIAPVNGITHITGTTAISTITVPTVLQGGAAFKGCIELIPDGIFTLATGGNIALASTAVVSRVLEVCYDGTSWYPSY